MKAKSLSKTVKAALVGAVIEREVIAVGEQPVFDLRGKRVPGNATGAAEATIVRQFATSAVKM